MLRQSVGQLAEATTEATTTIKSLLLCDKPAIRLAAAKAILDLAPKLAEFLELDERLRAIEQSSTDEGLNP